MNPQYTSLHQVADQLHYKFKDVVDDQEHPLAQSIMIEAKEVVEDLERNRPPRAIEDRIREVQHLLGQARDLHGAVISDNDYNNLFKDYDRLRENVRRLPNY